MQNAVNVNYMKFEQQHTKHY